MAKGGRGGKRGSGGGSTGGGNESPLMEGRENIELRAVMKDGEKQNITVSIQNTNQLDDLEGVDYVRGQGRFRETNVYRTLASDAINNAKDSKRETFMTEPEAKEGKWTKTDSMPIQRNIKGAHVLEKSSGYVTKVNGENFYLQKSDGKWKVNYKGMIASQNFSSLAKAKEAFSDIVSKVNSSESMKQSVSGYFNILNKNLGRVSSKVMREISQRDAGRVG